VIACAEAKVEQVVVFRAGGRLEDLFPFRKHVGHEDVRLAVVVDVRRVHAHGKAARVPGRASDGLGECSVAVVDVEEVVFLEIVRDVQVGAAVEIDIRNGDAEPEPFDPVIAVVDAGGGAHVHEMAAIVPVQPIRRCRVR